MHLAELFLSDPEPAVQSEARMHLDFARTEFGAMHMRSALARATALTPSPGANADGALT
jgi:hypothetical protein